MKIKIQIESISDSILFEHEKENNCIKDAVIYAVSTNADLRGANLRGADLRDADLTNAYLTGADLRYADLTNAYLTGADLRYADLRYADLRYAYLRDADLTGADLTDANIPMYCKWRSSIKNGNIIIGCKEKSPEEWACWLASEEEYSTKRGTPEFKQIEAVIRAYIAYLDVLK